MKSIDWHNVTPKHYALICIFILIGIGISFLMKPFAVNYYLDNQPIDDVWTSSYNATEHGAMGKVIVFKTYITIVKNDSFHFIEKLPDGRDGRIVEARYSNLMNCKPIESTQRKIAGSWNREPNMNNIGLYAKYNITFYAVWVIDGC